VNLKVLWIIPGDPGGSSMIFAKRQCEDLKNIGVEGRVYFLRSTAEPFGFLRELSENIRTCRAENFTHIHSQFGTATALFGAFLSVACRIPLLVTFRGSDLNHCPSDGFFRNIGQKLFSLVGAIVADRIVVVSEALKTNISWLRKRVLLLPSGVNFEVFKPMVQSEARRMLGWSHDRPVVLFNAGTSPAVKRLDLAEAAFQRARESTSDAELYILRADYPPDKMPLLMNASDVILMTSDHEGSPGIVKEALACNIPVVSVDVGDVRERIQGIDGCYLVTRNAQEISDALKKVLIRRRRNQSRESVTHNLDHKVLVQALKNFYSS